MSYSFLGQRGTLRFVSVLTVSCEYYYWMYGIPAQALLWFAWRSYLNTALVCMVWHMRSAQGSFSQIPWQPPSQMILQMGSWMRTKKMRNGNGNFIGAVVCFLSKLILWRQWSCCTHLMEQRTEEDALIMVPSYSHDNLIKAVIRIANSSMLCTEPVFHQGSLYWSCEVERA